MNIKAKKVLDEFPNHEQKLAHLDELKKMGETIAAEIKTSGVQSCFEAHCMLDRAYKESFDVSDKEFQDFNIPDPHCKFDVKKTKEAYLHALSGSKTAREYINRINDKSVMMDAMFMLNAYAGYALRCQF